MKFTGGPVNANRGFSAVLHARNTRNPLPFRDRAPSSNGYILLTPEYNTKRILFARGNDSSFVYRLEIQSTSLRSNFPPPSTDTIPAGYRIR